VTFGTLALIVAVGLLGPLLSLLPGQFAPPIVIGEIAAGVAPSATGTGTIDPSEPTLAFLASIGFALLMFIVGTHLPMRERRLRRAGRRGLLATAVTLAGALVLAPVLATTTNLDDPALLVVLIATSSAAVILPIVQSGTQHDSLLVTIAWVAILDAATIIAVPFVLATASVARAIVGTVLVVAGAGLVGLVGTRVATMDAVQDLRTSSQREGWALDLRVSLLVLFGLAYIAERFDTSVLIAGFAAGAMVATLGPPRRVAQQLIGIGEGFFVPLFFVVLGASINLRDFVGSRSDVWLFAALVIASVAVHAVAGLAIRLPLHCGILASAQLGVPAAVASIGLSTGDLTPGQAGAVVAAAAATLLVATVGAIRARASLG
jgi:Kef-type K+ transport system membrane component KefB